MHEGTIIEDVMPVIQGSINMFGVIFQLTDECRFQFHGIP